MAQGKWIKNITSDTKTVDAARHVLVARLAALREGVRDVLRDSGDRFDNVHQLRVAARRAAAALEIFEPCLKRKAHRKASKNVRRLRQAAGYARDLDVFLVHCTSRLESATSEDAATLGVLCGYAIAERIPAQVRLRDACAGCPFEIERWTSATVAAIVRPGRAIARMQGLGRAYLGELFDQIQRAIGTLTPSGENLHRVRLIAKRVRYAMEVFADCYPAPFRDELYPRVAELQDVLGNICDAQNQLARMESLRQGLSALLSSGCGRWSATLEGFCEGLKRTRLKSCDELEAWKA